MGWGFNLKDPFLSADPIYWKWVSSDPNHPEDGSRDRKLPSEIGSVSDVILRRNPVFDPGWGEVLVQAFQENNVTNTDPSPGAPPSIFNVYSTSGGSYIDEATHHYERAWILAEGIPALSWALGSHPSVQISANRQFDLATQFADQSGLWPRPKPNNVPEWQHSDMHNVAYLFEYRFFDKIVEITHQ
jgi:hypothetical protein